MNFPVILGRSTRKIPKSSRVPRSPFVIFLVQIFQRNYAGCGAQLSLKKGHKWPAYLDFKVYQKTTFQNGPAQTGAIRRRPAQTGADRRGPAQTGADRRRPDIFSVTGFFMERNFY